MPIYNYKLKKSSDSLQKGDDINLEFLNVDFHPLVKASSAIITNNTPKRNNYNGESIIYHSTGKKRFLVRMVPEEELFIRTPPLSPQPEVVANFKINQRSYRCCKKLLPFENTLNNTTMYITNNRKNKACQYRSSRHYRTLKSLSHSTTALKVGTNISSLLKYHSCCIDDDNNNQISSLSQERLSHRSGSSKKLFIKKNLKNFMGTAYGDSYRSQPTPTPPKHYDNLYYNNTIQGVLLPQRCDQQHDSFTLSPNNAENVAIMSCSLNDSSHCVRGDLLEGVGLIHQNEVNVDDIDFCVSDSPVADNVADHSFHENPPDGTSKNVQDLIDLYHTTNSYYKCVPDGRHVTSHCKEAAPRDIPIVRGGRINNFPIHEARSGKEIEVAPKTNKNNSILSEKLLLNGNKSHESPNNYNNESYRPALISEGEEDETLERDVKNNVEDEATFETDGNILLMNNSPNNLTTLSRLNQSTDSNEHFFPDTEISSQQQPLELQDLQNSQNLLISHNLLNSSSDVLYLELVDKKEISESEISSDPPSSLSPPVVKIKADVPINHESKRPEDAVLEKVTYLLTLHPKYFDKFYGAHLFLLKGSGPIKYSDRNYIAYISASRFRCHPLMDNQAREFIDNGGDPSWLANVDYVSPKYRTLHNLVKILAHQPWLIDKYFIQNMLKSQEVPQHNWSLSELVFAIAITTHFQCLCTLVHGCSWLYDLQDGSTNDLNEVPRRYCPSIYLEDKQINLEEVLVTPSHLNFKKEEGGIDDITAGNLRSGRTHHISSNEGSISSGEELIPIGVDVTQIENLEETEEVTVDTLIVKMKNLHQQLQSKNLGQNGIPSQADLVLRYEKVVESTIDGTVGEAKVKANFSRATTYLTLSEPKASSGVTSTDNPGLVEEFKKLDSSQLQRYETSIMEHAIKCQQDAFIDKATSNPTKVLGEPYKPDGTNVTTGCANNLQTPPILPIKFLQDPEFCYVDFAKRDCPSRASTFRYQDYSWEQHGFSLVSRFCNELSCYLDEKFKTAYHLTYSMMGNIQDVDTSMFRRAIWNYIHCLYGIRYDDYDYAEVNQLLARNLKRIIKTLACFPERIRLATPFSSQNSTPCAPHSLTPSSTDEPEPCGKSKKSSHSHSSKKATAKLIAEIKQDPTKIDSVALELLAKVSIPTTTKINVIEENVINKENFMRDFLESEKVHVNLMVMESKIQAQMLYALRAIMQYLTL